MKFQDVMLKADEYGFIKSLCLAVCLRMIRFCGHVFNTKQVIFCCEEYADKLSTILSKDIRWHTIRGQPMIERDILNVWDCCLEILNSLNQLMFSVSIDQNVLVMLPSVCKGSHEIS